MNLPAHSIRRLRQLLNWSLDGLTISREEAKEGLRILAPAQKSDKAKAFKKALRAAASSKIAKRQMTRNQIRAAVELRAGGKCEACGNPHPLPLRWDHWLGGSGRRIPQQSVATTWMLDASCESNRTENVPSAAWWNHVFEMHCRKYGYRFYAHIEKAGLPRRGTA